MRVLLKHNPALILRRIVLKSGTEVNDHLIHIDLRCGNGSVLELIQIQDEVDQVLGIVVSRLG